MKILVIGTGYVGLTTAVSFALQGHQVVGIDVDEAKVEQLQAGISPIYEPRLEAALQKTIAQGNLAFLTTPDDSLADSDAIYLCVGTPSDSEGFADLRDLWQAVESLQRQLHKRAKEVVVVIKSTVPIGTSDRIAKVLEKVGQHVYIVTNPEFLQEGRALQDALTPSRIVIGAEQAKAFAIMDRLYEKIASPRVYTTRTNAEMIKYASNAFLATRISFMNELARLCDELGADIGVVAEGMGLDNRIGPHFLRAGLGYGGSCFPKDTEALIQLANQHGTPLTLLERVREVNRSQAAWFLQRVRERIETFEMKRVALLGLSFKPETDDIREAPALRLIEQLHEAGAVLTAFDPVASAAVARLYPYVTFAATPYEAIRGADAAILVTEWKECTQLDFAQVKELMRAPNLFDGRNAWPARLLKEKGFTYMGIGRNL
jgi:UDPglucose 6-dehydrogenase